MSGKITELTQLPVSARSTNMLEIVDVGGNASYKATPNFILGLSGNPVGDTDSQTLTNKTLTGPTISGPVLSGTVTGTYTLGGTPTFPASVVTLTGAQTLTNKILTSPTISSPTITNASITSDTINGFTVANNGTIYGVAVSGGTLSGAAITSNTLSSASFNLTTMFQTVAFSALGASISGASTTYANLTNSGSTITLTLTKKLAATAVKVTIHLAFSNTTAAQVNFGVLVDGTTDTEVARTATGTATPHLTISGAKLITGLAAGSHTFVLRYKVGSGTLTQDTNDMIAVVVEEVNIS